MTFRRLFFRESRTDFTTGTVNSTQSVKDEYFDTPSQCEIKFAPKPVMKPAEKKLPVMILYVSDQDKSTEFYKKVLGYDPVLNTPGMTEFLINDSLRLGIMPEKNISKIICPHTHNPALANGIPRCEIYLFTEDPQKSLENAVNAGAKEISKSELRNWGDVVAYCSDPDGHILAFAK